MKIFKFIASVSVIFLIVQSFLLSACADNSDPLLKELNRHLEVDIQAFNVNMDELYPGEWLNIQWRSEGAIMFDARVYLSDDREISENDIKIIDEACGVEYNDHCYSSRKVEFSCYYHFDNEFSCFESDDLIGEVNLTDYFERIPFENYLILELCGSENCEVREHRIVFK